MSLSPSFDHWEKHMSDVQDLFGDMLNLPKQPGQCLPPYDPRLLAYTGSVLGALVLQQIYFENREDIRAWLHRNTPARREGRPLSPFPQPRAYSYRDLRDRLFPGLSVITVRRLIKDLEQRGLITLLPGNPGEQTYRISLSEQVSATIHAEVERRYRERMKREVKSKA